MMMKEFIEMNILERGKDSLNKIRIFGFFLYSYFLDLIFVNPCAEGILSKGIKVRIDVRGTESGLEKNLVILSRISHLSIHLSLKDQEFLFISKELTL